MKKEIELIEKLNKIPKNNLGFIKSTRMLFRLYFKHLNVFKLNYILKPVAIGLSLILLTTSTVYSYTSSSITLGNPLYNIKTGIENIISQTKTGLSKVKYYSFLIDRRITEIEYLKNNNFNKINKSISIINTAYAEDGLSYVSAIANTILEISKLNNKIDTEISNIKDESQKVTAENIFNEKKEKQKKVFEEIKNLDNNPKINKKVLNEAKEVIEKITPTIENKKQNNKEEQGVINKKENTKNDNNLKNTDSNINNEKKQEDTNKEIKNNNSINNKKQEELHKQPANDDIEDENRNRNRNRN